MEKELYKKSVALVGNMGYGKTLIGRDVASTTGYHFIDMERVLRLAKTYLIGHINDMILEGHVELRKKREKFQNSPVEYSELTGDIIEEGESYFKYLGKYLDCIDFEALMPLAERVFEFETSKDVKTNFTPEALAYAERLYALAVLKEALSGSNDAFILKLPANFCNRPTLTEQEEKVIKRLLQVKTLENLEEDFLSSFETVVNFTGSDTQEIESAKNATTHNIDAAGLFDSKEDFEKDFFEFIVIEEHELNKKLNQTKFIEVKEKLEEIISELSERSDL